MQLSITPSHPTQVQGSATTPRTGPKETHAWHLLNQALLDSVAWDNRGCARRKRLSLE